MRGFSLKVFMAVNTFAIRLSHGRLGSRLGTQTILLLHTLGRKSGRNIVTPIAYFYIEGYYFLVGSNWGKQQQPAWYYNLLAQPRTLIEVRGRQIQVEAYPAEGPEYERLWNYAIQHHPPYLHYQEGIKRRIPILILQPIN
jgi:deazaflavin-dependent oxidoreductase (nitroreductase family)